jgi:hypothetical protein
MLYIWKEAGKGRNSIFALFRMESRVVYVYFGLIGSNNQLKPVFTGNPAKRSFQSPITAPHPNA